MWNRPTDSYGAGEDTERKAVGNYSDLIRAFHRSRYVQEMSLRDLAKAAGVATSVVGAMDSGSAWPRLGTMRSVARALGLELHVDGSPDVAGYLVRHVRRTRRLQVQQVAFEAGVRRNTVSELDDPTRSPSMRTILAVAVELGLQVELRLATPSNQREGDRCTYDEGPVS